MAKFKVTKFTTTERNRMDNDSKEDHKMQMHQESVDLGHKVFFSGLQKKKHMINISLS